MVLKIFFTKDNLGDLATLADLAILYFKEYTSDIALFSYNLDLGHDSNPMCLVMIFCSLHKFIFTEKNQPVDQLVTCTWMHDPANGYNDTMVWLPEEAQICTGMMLFS